MKLPQAPVSWGELIDKITILEIKCARLTAEAARANATKELSLLAAIAEGAIAGRADLIALKAELTAVNGALWEIEDEIRLKEAAKSFDARFIELARSVYKRNDERAAIKRKINIALASELLEEKSYAPY